MGTKLMMSQKELTTTRKLLDPRGSSSSCSFLSRLEGQRSMVELGGAGCRIFETGFCVLMEHLAFPTYLMQQTVEVDNLISNGKAKTTE